MCSHVPKLGRAQPGRGEQKVRYYGYYSNVLRGKRKKEEQDNTISCIIEEGSISVEQRKSWARLIQKIYEVNPLTCPKCQGSMKLIAFIEQAEIIEKILKHLGLLNVKKRPLPKIHSPPSEEDYFFSQIPPWGDDQSSGSHTLSRVSPMPTEIQYYYNNY
jgi:hypothetical protein